MDPYLFRGPKDHTNIRISHSGSKGQSRGGKQKFRNHALYDPCSAVLLGGRTVYGAFPALGGVKTNLA